LLAERRNLGPPVHVWSGFATHHRALRSRPDRSEHAGAHRCGNAPAAL